jgi:hypothetical protein
MSMDILRAEKDNMVVWDGEKKGFYEVYFFKANHLRSGTAFWIRYTLLSPVAGDPVAELWAIFFDSRDPSNNAAFKQTFPASAAKIDRGRFNFCIRDSVIHHSGARGSISDKSGKISWDLSFNPAEETLRHFPNPRMYKSALPKTKYLSPNPDIRYTGTLEVNGRKLDFEGEPGEQSHIWGTKHAERWVWAHCNVFKGVEGSFFEALSASVKIGPIASPMFTLIFANHNKKLYTANSLWQAVRNKSDIQIPAWKFSGRGPGFSISGEASGRLKDFVGVEYTDPDGENLWCNNTKVANLNLTLSPDGEPPVTLVSESSAALEFVERLKDPRVPVLI